MTNRAVFWAGVREVLPLMVAIIPFSALAGIVALGVGLSRLQATLFSVLTFAGASQLAALDLLGRDAPLIVIVGTTVMINLRYVMYSASLSLYFQRISAATKALVGYVLIDQPFAVSMIRFPREPQYAGDAGQPRRLWFYLGMGLTSWTCWTLGTLLGVLLGASVPERWSLDFVIPLLFLALIFPAITDRASALAALTAGVVALVASPLPYNLGLATAAVAGMAMGLWLENQQRPEPIPTDPSAEEQP